MRFAERCAAYCDPYEPTDAEISRNWYDQPDVEGILQFSERAAGP